MNRTRTFKAALIGVAMVCALGESSFGACHDSAVFSKAQAAAFDAYLSPLRFRRVEFSGDFAYVLFDDTDVVLAQYDLRQSKEIARKTFADAHPQYREHSSLARLGDFLVVGQSNLGQFWFIDARPGKFQKTEPLPWNVRQITKIRYSGSPEDERLLDAVRFSVREGIVGKPVPIDRLYVEVKLEGRSLDDLQHVPRSFGIMIQPRPGNGATPAIVDLFLSGAGTNINTSHYCMKNYLPDHYSIEEVQNAQASQIGLSRIRFPATPELFWPVQVYRNLAVQVQFVRIAGETGVFSVSGRGHRIGYIEPSGDVTIF